MMNPNKSLFERLKLELEEERRRHYVERYGEIESNQELPRTPHNN